MWVARETDGPWKWSPPVPSRFKWTGCDDCTHRAGWPITAAFRAGPSGFGTALHQWGESGGGDVCVLDSAYLGFDIHTTEIEACLRYQLYDVHMYTSSSRWSFLLGNEFRFLLVESDVFRQICNKAIQLHNLKFVWESWLANGRSFNNADVFYASLISEAQDLPGWGYLENEKKIHIHSTVHLKSSGTNRGARQVSKLVQHHCGRRQQNAGFATSLLHR